MSAAWANRLCWDGRAKVRLHVLHVFVTTRTRDCFVPDDAKVQKGRTTGQQSVYTTHLPARHRCACRYARSHRRSSSPVIARQAEQGMRRPSACRRPACAGSAGRVHRTCSPAAPPQLRRISGLQSEPAARRHPLPRRPRLWAGQGSPSCCRRRHWRQQAATAAAGESASALASPVKQYRAEQRDSAAYPALAAPGLMSCCRTRGSSSSKTPPRERSSLAAAGSAHHACQRQNINNGKSNMGQLLSC